MGQLSEHKRVRSGSVFAGAAMGLMSPAVRGHGGVRRRPKAEFGPRQRAPAVPVSVSTAERRDMPYYLTGLGSVTAFYTDSIKSRVDGELVQVNFKEGQFVNKGDLLAVIDPRPYQVALEQAQATLFKDQASLRDAKLNYERYKGLLQDLGRDVAAASGYASSPRWINWKARSAPIRRRSITPN